MSGGESENKVSGKPVGAGDNSNENARERPDLRPLLSTDEVAAYIGVSRATIHNWIVHNGFPRIKAGRLNRHDLAEVQAWLKRNTALADHSAEAKREEHQKLARRIPKRAVVFTLD